MCVCVYVYIRHADYNNPISYLSKKKKKPNKSPESQNLFHGYHKYGTFASHLNARDKIICQVNKYFQSSSGIFHDSAIQELLSNIWVKNFKKKYLCVYSWQSKITSLFNNEKMPDLIPTSWELNP